MNAADASEHMPLPPPDDEPVSRAVPWRSPGAWLATVLVLAPFLSYPLALIPGDLAARRFMVRIPWPAIVACAAGLGMAAILWRGGPWRRPSRGVLPAAALWVATAAIAVACSAFGPLTVAGSGRIVALTIVALASATLVDDRHDRALQLGWACAAAAMAIGVLVQRAAGADPWGTIGNRNFVAGYLAASIPLALTAAWPARGLRWAAAALMLAAIAAAASRGAVVAAAVAAVAWGSTVPRRRWVRIGVIAATAAVVAVATLSSAGRTAARRLQAEDVRVAIWPASVRAVGDRPATGWGPGSFRVVFPRYRTEEYRARPDSVNATQHAHNEYLETAIDSGIPGVVALVGLLALAVIGWRRQGRGVASYGWAAVILAAHAVVDVNLRYAPNDLLFWAVLGRLWGRGGVVAIPSRRWVSVMVAAIAAAWAVVAVACPVTADLRLRGAWLARDAERWVDAREGFRRALQANPFNDNAWYPLGFACTRPPERWEAALHSWTAAADLAPHHADVDHNLGVVLLRLDRPAEAADRFADAVAYGPDPVRDLVWAARASLAAGDGAGALAALRQALERVPDHPAALRALADLNGG